MTEFEESIIEDMSSWYAMSYNVKGDMTKDEIISLFWKEIYGIDV